MNAGGYCIGGTSLSIAAAALSERGDTHSKDTTLFPEQTDFSEPGELSPYISPAQVEMLEALMHKEGALNSRQMGAPAERCRPLGDAPGDYVRQR